MSNLFHVKHLLNMDNLDVGKIGESRAEELLKSKGYSILEKNYNIPGGEIDIITRRGRTICFIEVKTSLETRRADFLPEQRVNRRKQQKLKNLSQIYMKRKKLDQNYGWQIDIISVIIDNDGNLVHIDHIENAVWESQY